MDYDGDLSLLRHLKRGNRRIGALGLSGGNAGAEGCAQACAFEQRGLTNFAVMGGISSFGGPMFYFANGNLNEGASCYWEECSTDHFLSLSHRRFFAGTSADVGFLTQIFRRETSVDRIRRYSGDLVLGLTDWETGEGDLVDIKTLSDPYTALEATMAMPVLYRNPVSVNGRRKYDGAIGIPFPAIEMIERWNLEGLVVFANRPRDTRERKSLRSAEALASMWMAPARRRALLRRHDLYVDGLRKLNGSRVPKLILWSSGKLGAFTRDSNTIRVAAENAQKDMEELLGYADV